MFDVTEKVKWSVCNQVDHMHQRIFHIRFGVVNSIGDANYADHICFHEMRFVLNCNAKSICIISSILICKKNQRAITLRKLPWDGKGLSLTQVYF